MAISDLATCIAKPASCTGLIAVRALQACTTEPSECVTQLPTVLASLQNLDAGSALTALDLLHQGLLDGLDQCNAPGQATNPFCSFANSAAAINVMRALAPHNQDKAITLWIQLMEALVTTHPEAAAAEDQQAAATNGTQGIFARALTGIAENVQGVVDVDVLTRAHALLNSLRGLPSLPDTSFRVERALPAVIATIFRSKARPASLPETTVNAPSTFSTGQKIAIAVTVVAVTAGASFAIWRLRQ